MNASSFYMNFEEQQLSHQMSSVEKQSRQKQMVNIQAAGRGRNINRQIPYNGLSNLLSKMSIGVDNNSKMAALWQIRHNIVTKETNTI